MSFDSTATTLAHIAEVQRVMGEFGRELMLRAERHDASKLLPDEKPVFDEGIARLRGVTYGSPEYEAVVEELAPRLALHYRRNSHHPEHYGQGIMGMDLFDLVEMLCDWIAAASANSSTGPDLDYNVELFKIEPQLAAILRNSVARWPSQNPSAGRK
jgi:hypothetical protein